MAPAAALCGPVFRPGTGEGCYNSGVHKSSVQMRVLKPEGLDAFLIEPSTQTYPMTVHSFHKLSNEQLTQLL